MSNNSDNPTYSNNMDNSVSVSQFYNPPSSMMLRNAQPTVFTSERVYGTAYGPTGGPIASAKFNNDQLSQSCSYDDAYSSTRCTK